MAEPRHRQPRADPNRSRTSSTAASSPERAGPDVCCAVCPNRRWRGSRTFQMRTRPHSSLHHGRHLSQRIGSPSACQSPPNDIERAHDADSRARPAHPHRICATARRTARRPPVAQARETCSYTGSFKDRGQLPQAAGNWRVRTILRAGVIAASAGNHAQGVAHHAHRLGPARDDRDAAQPRRSPRSNAPKATARRSCSGASRSPNAPSAPRTWPSRTTWCSCIPTTTS